MAAIPLPVVPFVADTPEAARLIDAAARPLASIADPDGAMPTAEFREAALVAAIQHDAVGEVAGLLFASRWGGGGLMLT